MYKPDTTIPYKSFIAKVYVNKKSEGGRNTPVMSDEKLDLNIFGENITCLVVKVQIPSENYDGMAKPGNHYILTFVFDSDITPSIWEGLDFKRMSISNHSIILFEGTILSLNN